MPCRCRSPGSHEQHRIRLDRSASVGPSGLARAKTAVRPVPWPTAVVSGRGRMPPHAGFRRPKPATAGGRYHLWRQIPRSSFVTLILQSACIAGTRSTSSRRSSTVGRWSTLGAACGTIFNSNARSIARARRKPIGWLIRLSLEKRSEAMNKKKIATRLTIPVICYKLALTSWLGCPPQPGRLVVFYD